MKISNIRLSAANMIGFLYANPAFIVGFCLLGGLLIGAYALQNACHNRTERKKEQLSNSIIIKKTEANVLGNAKTNAKSEVTNAQKNTNTANGDLLNSIRRDSGDFPNVGDAGREDRFCSNFCHDSTCFEWRKTHRCPGF
jgi:hypothetical protein